MAKSLSSLFASDPLLYEYKIDGFSEEGKAYKE